MVPGTIPSDSSTPSGQGIRSVPVLESDPVIEAYKKDVDRTLIRAQLRRTVDERVRIMVGAAQFAEALRAAGRSGTQP